MRKILSLLSLLMMALSLTSCQKEELARGLYYANTEDGIMYVELMRGHDCAAWFNPEDQNTGFWAVQDGGINLTISAKIKVGKYSHYWYCSSSSDESPVFNDEFYVNFHEMHRDRDFLLHFKKL